MTNDRVLVSGSGAIRTVTLNRPEQLNAVDEAMHHELGQVWDGIAAERDARVVVLTGAGRAFSAGGDVSWFSSLVEDADLRSRCMQEGRRIVNSLSGFPLPVIAAVNGPAVGLGCSLALLSDIVLMSDKAFFADPHVAIGLVAADGAAMALPLLTSLMRAKEFLFTGDRIDAATAERIGLANHVYPPDELLAAAYALAERLAGMPPQSVSDTKRLLNLHLGHAVDTMIDFAFAAESESFARGDFLERLGPA
jgi:enoyl-CoA hydratase